MDEEDDSAALAHQMELEARQQLEEEALAKSRRLLEQLRRDTKQFEVDMTESRNRTNWRDWHGDHG